jgi:hypothetical protein
MPDNEDYAELARLLANPRAWTVEERAAMRGLLRQQTENLATVHPRDDKRRASLQALVGQVTEAIGESDGPT